MNLTSASRELRGARRRRESPGAVRCNASRPVIRTTAISIRKLEGGPNIINGRMPAGGPFLDQTTIDSIRLWITNGAAQ